MEEKGINEYETQEEGGKILSGRPFGIMGLTIAEYKQQQKLRISYLRPIFKKRIGLGTHHLT